jgi:hypothetical protein
MVGILREPRFASEWEQSAAITTGKAPVSREFGGCNQTVTEPKSVGHETAIEMSRNAARGSCLSPKTPTR